MAVNLLMDNTCVLRLVMNMSILVADDVNKRFEAEKKKLEKVVAVRKEGKMKVVDLEVPLSEATRTVERLELSLVALSSFEEESEVSVGVGNAGCCRKHWRFGGVLWH